MAKRRKRKGWTGRRHEDSRDRVYKPDPNSSFGTRVRPPVWEGTYGFRQVWDGCQVQLFDTNPVAMLGGEEVVAGADAVALIGLSSLAQAHPVYIGTEQILALPLSESDPMTIIREAVLPFPYVFLDFCSARGPAHVTLPFRSDDGRPYEADLYGCLVADADSDSADRLAALKRLNNPRRPDWHGQVLVEDRCVIPFGSCVYSDFENDGWAGRVPTNADDQRSSVHSAAPMGLVTLTSPDGVQGARLITGQLDTGQNMGLATYMQLTYRGTKLIDKWLDQEFDFPTDPRGDLGAYIGGTGAVIQDVIADGKVAAEKGDSQSAALAMGMQQGILQAALVYAMAEQAARALYLLTAANVHVAEAPVSRQVRRQAKRSGARIASVVTVRRTQVRREGVVTHHNGHRDFTHRFERRAHYRHVTKGPHFKPDHVKPCNRRDENGELTCPNGCRREVVSAAWVGPEHLPMIPKARRVAIPPMPELEDDDG